MSPIASYRQLLRLAGPLYVVIAFVGRLPLAMSQMGALLLVSGTTGSYAAGGLAAGSLAVANAVCSPVAAALADRVGQRPVVLVQSVLGGLGLLALVALARSDASGAVLATAAGATGAFLPQIGPLARVRWRPITRGAGARQHRLVEAAFSYEGAADEATFVLGPALLGLLLLLADPGAGLVVAAVLLVGFGGAFALHPTARLAHTPRREGQPRVRVMSATLAVLMVAQGLIGAFFGSVQTGTSVLATAEGHAGIAGLVHAVLGVGSVAAGLAIAGVPERFGFPLRMLVAAAGLLVLSLPLLAVGSLQSLVLVVLVLGFVVAPYMISNFTMGERSAPPAKVGTAMTLLAAATGLGYAVGSAVAGRLADSHGHTAAFGVTVGAAAGALALSLAAQPLLRRQRPAREAALLPVDVPVDLPTPA
ncbi:MFS transporter [Pedococcus sp. 2YAF34]|uniref:MFS transporter n=1 Tax=Pedococcus sp. 2YAF34 TaxID=3233032 RepID=UPI003F947A60